MRAAPLEWVGIKLDVPVRHACRSTALATTSLQYKESRLIPTEAVAYDDSLKAAAREAAIAAGKLPPEDDRTSAFNATPKAWFKALVADIAASLATLKALDDVSRTRSSATSRRR